MQHRVPTFRRSICLRATLSCLPSRPPLFSQRSATHASSAPHGLATAAAAGSDPPTQRKLAAGGVAASAALLPLLLRAFQPGAAFAEEAATALQQATSGGDIAVGAAEKVISSAVEDLAPGSDSGMSLPDSGMSLTDTVTSVLFVLAVLALLVLTLGVRALHPGRQRHYPVLMNGCTSYATCFRSVSTLHASAHKVVCKTRLEPSFQMPYIT